MTKYIFKNLNICKIFRAVELHFNQNHKKVIFLKNSLPMIYCFYESREKCVNWIKA